MVHHFNLVGLAVNISRAYEIAAVGGHSLKIVRPADSTLPIEDIQLLNEFYGLAAIEGTADMTVELAYSPEDILCVISGTGRYETISDIRKRISDVNQNQISDTTLDNASKSLLKSAIGKLDLSITDTMQILNVATTIARMDKKTNIKIEHIAEAVQYKSAR